MNEAGSSGNQQQKVQLGIHFEYAKSIRGILKGAQAVCTIVVLILSNCLSWGGSGWVTFVGVVCLIGTIVHFLFHFLGITERITVPKGWNFVEMCAYGGYSVLYLVAGIVGGAMSWINPILIVSSIFSFVATLAYTADTSLYYFGWRREVTSAPPTNRSKPEIPAAPVNETYQPSGAYHFDNTASTVDGNLGSYDSPSGGQNDYSTPAKW